ncbi:MAG: chromate transporter [Alphaproteobacteria bacterium]|nr:chromate transporter [Alphaproteobacteria bacterium]
MGAYGQLIAHFAVLSLLAVGGVPTVIPEMHRHAVDVAGWLSDTEFTNLFAIAQGAPGPNMTIVTLIGWHVTGLGGALVATAAFCVPCCVLTYFVFQLWNRWRDRPWRVAVQAGLSAVTIGIVAAGALVIAIAADTNLARFAITLATAALAWWTRLNPLWALGAAGVIGALGFA